MPSRMLSPTEIRRMIDEDQNCDESYIEVMEELINMADGRYTIIYNNDNKKFFAAEDNKPIPPYLHDFILSASERRYATYAN